MVTEWVEIISPYEDSLFRRGDGKRPDSRHDVADGLTRLEFLHKIFALSVESAIPEDFSKVETIGASIFLGLDSQTRTAGENLVIQDSKLVVLSQGLGLVDDSFYMRTLVKSDLAYDVLVWKVFFS